MLAPPEGGASIRESRGDEKVKGLTTEDTEEHREKQRRINVDLFDPLD
jgi:hypothetical protein